MNTLSRSSRVLLAVIATVLVFSALRATETISLPLFFGVVLLLFFQTAAKALGPTPAALGRGHHLSRSWRFCSWPFWAGFSPTA